MRRLVSFLRSDPRHWQITSLSLLLAWGTFHLGFELGAGRIAATVAAALLTQLAFTRIRALPRFDPLSALISGLSTCLLLRTAEPWMLPAGAALAVATKFLLRVDGKHVFNPTNIGIVALMLVSNAAWVSPGQWGSATWFAFLMACLGGMVVHRSLRSDVTIAFLAFHAALLFGRSLLIGEPLTIPLHRLETGSLLLFAFFMISDPKTTPDARAGRILFAAIVAAGAWFVTFRLFRTNGLLWSLAACSLLVPVIDRVLPGPRYRWPGPAVPPRFRTEPTLAPPPVPALSGGLQ